MNNLILFGSGTMGYRALKLFNKEVICFCDNNEEEVGLMKWGKKVISFQQLKEQYKEYIIIVCVSMYHDKAKKIALQLEDAGIINYWLFEEIEDSIMKLSEEKRYIYIYNKNEMYDKKCSFFINKMQEMSHQLQYLRENVDIRYMKKASGCLRERQLKLVEVSNQLFKELEKLNIYPFLCYGNLLGYIRHNGFIPWDDDIDFGLIRKDYEKLRDYCYDHMDKDGELHIDDICEKYYFIDSHQLIKIGKYMNDGKFYSIDFFSFDYYEDNYNIKDLLKFYREVKESVNELTNKIEKIEFVRNKIKTNVHIVEKSRNIYMGVDGQFEIKNKLEMIPEEVLYPLKKATFEGKEFWVPNKPEEFCSYLYKDMWDFPEDVGIPKHLKY